MTRGRQLVLLLASWGINASVEANVVINEVAYRGSGESTCLGEDWIELLNTGTEAATLDNYRIIQDSSGPANPKSIAATLGAGEFLVLCGKLDFDFGIGSGDAISLISPAGSSVSSVTLPETGGGGGDDLTYSFVDGEYRFTATPTPGGANIYTEPLSLEERLRAQNDEGNDFFLVNDAQTTFAKVVDIHVSLREESLSVIEDHPAWEIYVPFEGLSVSNVGNDAIDAVASTAGGGEIRTRGQSTNSIVACMGTKNVPFLIQFDSPFLGMETMYLRNHFGDPSYMRDAGSHVMLEAFGLPYIRTRPARLFMNGEYVGFYTVMEAPTQGYVMQRSFGPFDPEKTALFKAKTFMAECPYTDISLPIPGFSDMKTAAAGVDPSQPYYFERGEHRADMPVLGAAGYEQCGAIFFGEIMKEQIDVARFYLDHGESCGSAMVEMGRVDRDYGPESLEESMASFLDSTIFDANVDDITTFIDVDQWLQNFAAYALMLNFDSPITIINNWYMATTEGGANDWKIIQYDHNNIAFRDTAGLCGVGCGPRMVYLPILRPTCESVEDHKLVGKVLNSEENVQKYLGYVEEYVNALLDGGVLEKLRGYGQDIKEYVVEDPLNTALSIYAKAEDYEETELGTNVQDYNSAFSPFLKTMQVRAEEVRKQLDAIKNGTLPRDGVYEQGTVCPDWRDPNHEDYIPGSTLADDCAIPGCKDAGGCYGPACISEGVFWIPECNDLSPLCDSCFPYSKCGSGDIIQDYSSAFISSETCGPEFADCAAVSACFDHKSGICAFDGEILTVECQAEMRCMPCFPYSRCGSGEPPETPPTKPPRPVDDGSGTFVESDACGPVLAECAQAAQCFKHAGFCGEDGSFTVDGCDTAVGCKTCFPGSRCGEGGATTTPPPNDMTTSTPPPSNGTEGTTPSPNDTPGSTTRSSAQYRRPWATMVASPILTVAVAVLSWCWMLV